jgi:hypothetical protein
VILATTSSSMFSITLSHETEPLSHTQVLCPDMRICARLRRFDLSVVYAPVGWKVGARRVLALG